MRIGGVTKVSAAAREYPPGTAAPSGGTYEQCSVLGAPTGVRVTVARGQELPAAPRGFTWRAVESSPQQQSAAD
jgi:hypothetical protein